jgi:hypothetical protein
MRESATKPVRVRRKRRHFYRRVFLILIGAVFTFGLLYLVLSVLTNPGSLIPSTLPVAGDDASVHFK